MRRPFCIALICLALVLVSPLALREIFFNLPGYSSVFDCDDGTLLMLERLHSIGISSTPILGNLKMSGEKYPESDHVWLLADIAGQQIALDQGGGTN